MTDENEAHTTALIDVIDSFFANPTKEKLIKVIRELIEYEVASNQGTR